MQLADRISLGCDPEIFVMSGPRQVSCHNLLPGTKKEPVKVEGGAVQVDGTAAEFNIDPSYTLDEFTGNISKVISTMERMMRVSDKKTKFTWIPVRKYSKRNWAEIPDYAKEMGCDPDFNAYTGKDNPRPHCDEPTLRSAGGHVHIGWCTDASLEDPRHILDCRLVAAALDTFLLPFSLSWDKDETRRKLYGNPGAFRIKSYGVEYRTLSNMWVANKNTQEFVFKIVRTVMSFLRSTSNDYNNHKKLVDLQTLHDFGEICSKAFSGDEKSYNRMVSGEFYSDLPKHRPIRNIIDKYAEMHSITLRG